MGMMPLVFEKLSLNDQSLKIRKQITKKSLTTNTNLYNESQTNLLEKNEQENQPIRRKATEKTEPLDNSEEKEEPEKRDNIFENNNLFGSISPRPKKIAIEFSPEHHTSVVRESKDTISLKNDQDSE
jgi:hypothetical protein